MELSFYNFDIIFIEVCDAGQLPLMKEEIVVGKIYFCTSVD